MNVPCESELLQQFDFYNHALFIRRLRTCVVSDIHIGLEETLYSQGLHFPLHEDRALLERFEAILDRFDPATVVLAGDIFHAFDRVGKTVQKKFLSLIRTLQKESEVVFVRGSHDTMLPSLVSEALDRYDFGGFTIVHGDQFMEDHGFLVMGHDHPVIEIDLERFPCFLYGRKLVQGKDVIVMPAFNPLSPGVTINYAKSRNFLSPFLQRADTGRLQPIVEADGEAIVFPPLAEMRRFM